MSGIAKTTASLSRCFRCGSTELAKGEVEDLTRHGRYVIAMRVMATVCRRCGERYFDGDTVRLFEQTREKVRRGDLEGLRVTGELLEPVSR